MTDRNRSIVRQGRRDVAPTRSPSRSVVPEPQHAPGIVRQPPVRGARHEVIPAPDLQWRFVPREGRRNADMVSAARRDVATPRDDDRRYGEPDYRVEYEHQRPVRYRVDSDGNTISVNVHVHNENRAGGGSDMEGLWIGGGFVAAAFIIGLFLAVALHH